MTAARLVTVQGIVSDEFAHSDEIVQAQSLLQFDVHAFRRTRDEQVSLELLTNLLQQFQRCLQTFFRTAHADIFPHDMTQFLVDGIH